MIVIFPHGLSNMMADSSQTFYKAIYISKAIWKKEERETQGTGAEIVE